MSELELSQIGSPKSQDSSVGSSILENTCSSSSNSSEFNSSKEKIKYFDPEQLKLVYDGYVYHIANNNDNGTIRWRCIKCFGVALVTKDDYILVPPKIDSKHKTRVCKQMCVIETNCKISYEKLKFDSQKASFKFTLEYANALKELQANYNNTEVAKFWPKESSAKSTTSSIRHKCLTNSEKACKSTKDIKR